MSGRVRYVIRMWEVTQFCVMPVTSRFTKGVVAKRGRRKDVIGFESPCVGECRKEGSTLFTLYLWSVWTNFVTCET